MLTFFVVGLVALAAAFVLTRAVACVALPLSPEVVSTESGHDHRTVSERSATGSTDAVAPPGPGLDAGMGADPADGPTTSDRSAPRRRRAGGGDGDDREPAAASSSGPRVIPREEVERVLADPSELRGARVSLHEVDGEPVGLELSGITPGGPLARIGLRPGDVLMAVNGITVHDADGAIDAISRLRSATDLRVRILRGGRPRTLRYVID